MRRAKISAAVAAAAVSIGLLSAGARAAVVTWSFENVTGASPPTVSTAPPSGGTPVANLAVGDLSGTSQLASQTGVFNNASSSGYTGASGANDYGLYVAPGNTGYLEVTLTPDAGYAVQLSDLDFGSRSTATGPLTYTVKWSADGYASTIYTAAIDKSGSTWKFYDSNFAAVTDTVSEPVTVRVFLSDGTGSPGSSANSRFDDVKLDVSAVALAPEPASLGLLAAAGLPLAARRRRRA
jgi:hypothetical protein